MSAPGASSSRPRSPCSVAALALVVVAAEHERRRGSSTVSSRLSDFRINASPSTVAAGRVTFNVRNTGGHRARARRHQDQPAGAANLPLRNGRASETRVARRGGGRTGGSASASRLNLTAGHYVLICNIGQHYRAGMRRNFTVR